MNSKFESRTLKLAVASTLALGLSAAATDSYAATASADATATVVAPISISKTSDLKFGKFAAMSGGASVIEIQPGGNRSKVSGGAVLLVSGSQHAAASFNVEGEANASYAITLPAGTVQITRDGGSETMDVTNFVSQPGNAGTLSGAGSQTLTVGARLAVANNQLAGSYAGSFNTTVEYN